MSERIQARGVVVRILIHPQHGTFALEYRTRDLGALLAEAEWGWAPNKDVGYVFGSFIAAETHALALKASGERHVHAAVFGEGCAQARAERQDQRETTILRSVREAGVTPADSYARTCRYLGERDE